MDNTDYKPVEGEYLTYLGKPLVREGDTICYGSKYDKYILILEILSYRKEVRRDTEKNVDVETEIPDKVLIQVVDTKDPLNIHSQAVKNSLSEAMNFGRAWLDIANGV